MYGLACARSACPAVIERAAAAAQARAALTAGSPSNRDSGAADGFGVAEREDGLADGVADAVASRGSSAEESPPDPQDASRRHPARADAPRTLARQVRPISLPLPPWSCFSRRATRTSISEKRCSCDLRDKRLFGP